MNLITSKDNPRVKAVADLLKDGDARRKQGLFVCEGAVMLGEALRSGAVIKEVFCLEGSLSKLPEGNFDVSVVSEPVLKKISDLETSTGIVFTAKMPEAPCLRGKTVALERIMDPGNMGTVLRTADAFGFSTVALLGNCVDPYAPKTVRASMGSVFRMNVVRTDMDSLSAFARAEGKKTVAAVLDRSSKSIRDHEAGECIFVIGNEARGLSPETAAGCDEKVFIPIVSSESLNAAVAASILMWESVR